ANQTRRARASQRSELEQRRIAVSPESTVAQRDQYAPAANESRNRRVAMVTRIALDADGFPFRVRSSSFASRSRASIRVRGRKPLAKPKIVATNLEPLSASSF